ncbi:MAG: hypothetical protein JNL80_09075 [Phycisphaerae bacterium]|jgi:uncharacterized membrane protein|nr:hypothetical protein [Phycisphaerae bacterium]
MALSACIDSLLSLDAFSLAAIDIQSTKWTLTPTRFLGRLHPILVHFPIGLITMAALAEVWRLLRRLHGLSPITVPLVIVSALAAVAASGAGWLNAAWEHDGDGGILLDRHRWLGTIISAVLVALAIFAWRQRHARELDSSSLAVRLGTILCAAIVGLVGHIGGELVYGEGYLWKGLLAEARRADQRATAPAAVTGTPEEIFFLTRVKPIITERCAECHGAEKQKGGLRLDPIGLAFDGPADAWSIVAGFPEDSELIVRLQLPRDDPDAMPPKGDGLTDADISLLQQWIRNGAVVPPSERTAESAQTSTKAPPQPPAEAVLRSIEQCTLCGAIATPMFSGSNLFSVNASMANPPWSDAQLAVVAEAASAIVALNLARSQVSDSGLASLPPMPALEILRLDDTAIGDAGLAPILSSERLASANLVGTRVSDEGLARLLALPSLRQVYVWRTQVTEAGIAKARQQRPDVQVVGAEPPPGK